MFPNVSNGRSFDCKRLSLNNHHGLMTMYDYSKQIEAFREARVRLSPLFKEKLLAHRQANRDRLTSRLPSHIKNANVSERNFKPQGSAAMGTIIQTRFVDEEYDIDDGLVIPRNQLINADSTDMSALQVKESVREALKDGRFNRQPKLFLNCVRVFYAEDDEEKHHVDFPVYRSWSDNAGNKYRELASEDAWVPSNPTQVNTWFNDIIKNRNESEVGWGTQFRHLIQLLKRFCRSRSDWLDLLPNGLKLTMLVAECQPNYNARLDVAFADLLANIKSRLETSKIICNLAHPDQPMLTRSENDDNVQALLAKIGSALEQIDTLDEAENDNEKAARAVWNWIFMSDGFFKEYDEAAAEARKSLSQTPGLQRFNVPWREAPTWKVVQLYNASVIGRWAENSNSMHWHEFQNDGPPLGKHMSLRFFCQTNTPKPFHVFWQVVNTGSEAARVPSGLRGQIIRSTSNGAGGLQTREESTLYAGMHWIECFIIKDDLCVARSGPFVVNIQ